MNKDVAAEHTGNAADAGLIRFLVVSSENAVRRFSTQCNLVTF